jgi:hypothetical protein
VQFFTCRVCGASEPTILLAGTYSPFFQLRVDVQRDPFLQYWRAGRFSRYGQLIEKAIRKGPKLVASQPLKLLRVVKALAARGKHPAPERMLPAHRTLLIYCTCCNSVTPCHDFTYEELCGLYRDYRGPEYNRDRVSVEPAYAAVVDRVGNDPEEVSKRNAAADAFLRKNAAVFKRGLMLDYGGSDGRFVPPCAKDFFDGAEILDVSDAALHETVDARFVRKVAKASPGGYSFVSCMHVLEHVGNPRDFALGALRYVAPGGHLYIETPAELQDKLAAGYGRKQIDRTTEFSEHINKYSRDSIAKLVASTGCAKVIDERFDVIDQGWSRDLVSRTLIEKTAAAL